MIGRFIAALPPATLCATFRGGLDALASLVVRRAARHTPPSLSERLEEEWLAELAARPQPMGRLRLAVGCWWASRVIARELAVARLATASATATHNAATSAVPHDRSFPPRRITALLFIACLHLALVYFLATGLAPPGAEVPPAITHAWFTMEQPTLERPPPLPAPARVAPRRVEVPQPDIPLDMPADANPNPGVTIGHPEEPAPQPAAKVTARIMGGPGKGFPNTADYYPNASRRLGEKGVATVRACVDGNGRLTTDPTIAQSSGSARLDAGSLTLARAGSGHYRPTTEDGRLVSSCFEFHIRFELKE